MVAIATACDSLVSGQSDLALAGGVCVLAGPEMHVRTAQTGMLSKDGRCFTFDQRANGFVPGEGVGAVLLKRLSEAEKDHDIILGVIEGWGVNQDGKTNGITAPNPQSQTRLQQEVYDKYRIDPAGIQLIEAHGTGTKLGDPIEVDALKQSFGKYTQRAGYCALGSVKTNIGHCFTAAGLASTLKVLLALQHRQLPPSINFERLNEHISLKDSPFYVNDRLRDWEAQGQHQRRAAISGFGFGGTNAHIVIAEYSAPGVARPAISVLRESGKVIVPLSARTEDQLRRKAADLLDFLSGKGRSADLLSTAYTLQVGREPMEVRWGVLADSIEELRSKLRAYLRDEGAREGIHQGRVSESKEAMSLIRSDDVVQQTIIERLIAQRKLAKLLELWVKGLAFDWHSLYGDSKPQRIGLPLYPFAKQRYWVDSVQTVREAGAKRVTSALHPLLHRNTSNFSQHGFSSTLRGDESFLAGSEPDGAKALPGAAYLEMARAAVVQVASAEEPVVVELHDIAWAEPFRVTDEKEISIALFPNADETIEFEIYSGQGGQEIVHCQGRAVLTPQSAQIRLDLRKLEEQMIEDGAEQLLTQLDLPGVGLGGDGDCALYPGSMDSVLQAWADFKEPGQALSPVALRQVRLMAGCPREIIAWVRCSTTGPSDDQHATLDIDLCDAKGNVCVEIRELSAQRLTVAGQRASVASITTAAEPATGHDAESAAISHARLLQELKASLARALYLSVSDISVDKPFIELGLDSIVGVEWVGEVNKTYNLKLTATKTYDYPNITELASYIETELKKSFVPPAKKTRAAVVNKSTVPAATTACARLKRKDRGGRAAPRSNAPPADKIAVIGMSGRYPQAGNLGQFWENLARGRSSITEVPPSRWDVSRYYDPNPARTDKIYCKWLGALDEVDCFDPLFFRISPAEAKGMDPQHRLFLEESYKAFEDAGYSGKALSHKKCGVYLGAIGNEYSSLISQGGSVPGDLTGNSFAIGAARIAYFLNLKGPAISIDTACSSSLVAIHLACQGLLNHETDMALAGGVTVYLKPDAYFGMCQAGMLSADGRCKTFDDSANGFVPGEGVGVIVLKRLQDALRDHDRIYGIILGSGINQDGKTNGITAPSVNSQIELGRELYARYKIDPETISYVEAHGTGTKLGDPIELEALSTVFKEKTSKQNYCALGSVKSNIGHTSGAAGVASVQKVLLCMQHRTLVPSLNVTKENSLFDFASSPFYVSKETRSWNAGLGSPRRAGVSSFGFSGTNAHLVLEEYVPPPGAHAAASVARPDSGVMILLSARTAEQLRQKATDLLQFLRADDPGKSKDLMAIAYTLFTGRDVMDERAGFLAHSVDELVEQLPAYIGGRRVAGVCQGRVVRGDDGVLIERENKMTKDLLELLGLWVRGLELDWRAVYGDAKQQRVALPGYPFARKRYWVDTATGQPPAETKAEAQVLHPLLHRNSSILGQHGYSSTFTGAEPFLIDPGLTELSVDSADIRKVLPAMAYLEMARAALQKAVPAACESAYPQLRDIVWGRPLVASRSRQVNIALFRKSEEQVDFEIYSLNQESESPAQEIVHAQGHAVFQRKPARTRLDMDKLRTQRGDRHLLVELRLPREAQASRNDYLLHPSLLDEALHASSAILGTHLRSPGHPSLPFALDVLRIESACAAEMYAWIRLSQHSPQDQAVVKLDIDLCDRQGQVCVALRGLAYEGMAHEGRAYEGLTQEQPRGSAPPAARKPTAISLAAAAERTADRKPRQIAVVTLESPVASATARPAHEA
jgi:polyketide synthase PksN